MKKGLGIREQGTGIGETTSSFLIPDPQSLIPHVTHG